MIYFVIAELFKPLGGAMACLFDICINDALSGNSSVLKDSSAKASKSDSSNKLTAHSTSCLHFLEVSYLSPCRGSTSIDIETHSLVGLPASKQQKPEEKTTALLTNKASSSQNSGLGARSLPQGCVNAKLYSMKHGARNKVAAEATMSFWDIGLDEVLL